MFTRYSQLSDKEVVEISYQIQEQMDEAKFWEWTYFLLGFNEEYAHYQRIVDMLEELQNEALGEIEYRVYWLVKA